MILLNVEEKCQNCPNFSPTVERIDMTTLGGEKKYKSNSLLQRKRFL